METISFQNYIFPAIYITGFSYSKTARLRTTATGYARPLGFNPSEISIRILADRPRAMVSERDFAEDFNLLKGMSLNRDSIPTQVVYAGHIIYPSLEFRITSITKTTEMDTYGNPVAIEVDVTLSGVRCTKEETGRRALVFNEDFPIPKAELTCKGKTLEVGDNVTVAELTLTPETASLTLLIGNDLAIVEDAPWLLALVQNEAVVSVDGYGSFYIVSANLVEGELEIQASKWPKQKEITETYMDVSLSEILTSITGNFADVDGHVSYYLRKGTELDAVKALQESCGFLIDYAPEGISFRRVPTSIAPDTDFSLYIDEDLATETVSGLVWRSPSTTYTVGENPNLQVDSCLTTDSPKIAQNCLKFVQYMQNSITITTAIDSQIKHHSAINLIKGNQLIRAMVESYQIDFIQGAMTLELHYISR